MEPHDFLSLISLLLNAQQPGINMTVALHAYCWDPEGLKRLESLLIDSGCTPIERERDRRVEFESSEGPRQRLELRVELFSMSDGSTGWAINDARQRMSTAAAASPDSDSDEPLMPF